MCVGDDILCLHTLSDVEDLPGKVGTDCRFEKLSTDRSDCRLSFAAPVGVLLSCNHVYNQFIFIDDHAENLKNFEHRYTYRAAGAGGIRRAHGRSHELCRGAPPIDDP